MIIHRVRLAGQMFTTEALKVSGLWCLFQPDDKFATILSEVEMSVRLRKKGFWVKGLANVSFGHRDFLYDTLPEEALGCARTYSTLHDQEP
jgi:hypothetical protein